MKSSLPLRQSAFFTLYAQQRFTVLFSFLLVVELFILNWHVSLIVLISILSVLYFLDFLFYNFLAYQEVVKRPEIRVTETAISALREDDLPVYTILCPLYKEAGVLGQFISAMKQLDYPTEKLQILLLLEEDDRETIRSIQKFDLPNHFQPLFIPHSLPKTKPKALNYSLPYIAGEYVVIYDAEDVPDSFQLKKAVIAFGNLAESVVCLQAKLDFYNPTQNILTRLFTAEYSLWFGLILPGLQWITAPIPLGGTSNHLRTSVLRRLGGWDSFNVTEDCDLGMRLYKQGFSTDILDSVTLEEANSQIGNWVNQRTRWVKGYMQTYFVHSRDFFRIDSVTSFYQLLLFIFLIGNKVLFLLMNPILWALTFSYFAFRPLFSPFIDSLFLRPVLYIAVFTLVFSNFLYFYYFILGCLKHRYYGFVKYMIFVPFYWLLMSWAAWRSLFELVFRPHYWSKTLHGLHLGTEE
jgi:cellulose synthase/poly-beta-1,6-N-acetylglucosamine synthase-like glycosyltransferase